MKKPLFRGLCTALVTPFSDGKVNLSMLEQLIRRQIDCGVRAIVLAGTTGEAPTLSFAEKQVLFRRGVEAAGGECLILAGTGSNDTRQAVALSKMAEQTGVDGLLAVTPYYNKTTQPGLVHYYKTIARAVSLPVIAYHVPGRTGMQLTLETCRSLAQIPNLAGLKDASGDISRTERIIAENGAKLPVWSGCDDQTVATMAVGAQGVISVASNVLPVEMNAMVHSALRGDYEMAAFIQRKLLPFFDLMFCRPNPIPVKAAMKLMGCDAGCCREPLMPPDEELECGLQAFFHRWKEDS